MQNKSKYAQTLSVQPDETELPDVELTVVRLLPILILSLTLWAVFSLPSIMLSQWFPLDLAKIFEIGKNFQNFLPGIISPYNGTGRYFPFYWLYNSFEFYLFGTNVAPYYLVQSIVFLGAALLMAVTLHKVTGSLRLAGLLLIAIYFSTPVAENLNTLGKMEIVQFFLMMCIILAFCLGHVTGQYKWGITGFLVFASTFFILSIWTKETSIALFGFCMTGIVLSIFLGLLGKIKDFSVLTKDYLYLLLALIVSLCISKAPYVIFTSSTKTASYTNYAITPQLVRENLSFYLHQQPDVIIFGVLALVLMFSAGRKLFFNGSTTDRFKARGYILVMSLLAMAWAFYLALLVWRWPMSYYMLLPALMFKLCTMYGIYMIYLLSPARRMLRFVTYGAMALSLIYATFYIYYITSSQIAYSRIYTEALQKYVSQPGQKKTLIIESYPFYAEQITATAELLKIVTGSSFHIEGIADVLDPVVTNNVNIYKLYNITRSQIEENKKNLPKQGDYLLAITGNKLATWFLRGVTPYYNEDSLLRRQGAYNMDLVAEREITLPALYQNVQTSKFEVGETSIGYKLYRILDNEPKFSWKGRYPDGWVGKKSTLWINSNYRKPVVIRISAPGFPLPNSVRISKDGHLIKELKVTDANEIVLPLSDIVQGHAKFQFEIKKVFVPRSIMLNQDKRELGLRIELYDGPVTAQRVSDKF